MSAYLQSLSALLDLLKSKGVTRFLGPVLHDTTQTEIDVTLTPVEPAASDKPNTPKGVEEDLCACGCPMHMHVEGLCASGLGCDEAKCATKGE